MARSKEKKKVAKAIKETYQEGDLVFAKLRGFKAWPSRVIEVAANARYQVFFYGTHQTCYIGAIDLEPFDEGTLAKYRNTKTKYFKESLDEILQTPEIFEKFMPSAIKNEPETIEKPSELQQIAEALKTPVQGVPVKRTPRGANKRKAEEKDSERVKAESGPSSNANTNSGQKKIVAVSTPLTKVPVVDIPCSDPRMYFEIPGSSELVEIEIGRNKPKFKSKEEEEEWNKGSVKNLAILQEALKSGNYLPDEVRRTLKAKGTRTAIEEELLKIPQHKPISEAEIQLLKDESHLIELNFDLRESFSIGNADMTKGLRLLNLMNEIKFTKLQVLKNPEIEETFWELMVFYEEEHLSNIKAKVDQARRIRDAATALHQKIRALFNMDDEDEFKIEFPKILEKFHNSTKELQENERCYLTEIPSSFNA